MKAYKDSDYAVNKFSPNIVYHFASGTVEITLEDYLKSNPDKTEQDFAELKDISDEIYYESDLEDTNYRKGKLSIHSLEKAIGIGVASFEYKLIQDEENQQILEATYKLLKSGKLTKTQKRRFILHNFNCLSIRAIAEIEKVKHQSVSDSLMWANKKLKIFFLK